MEKGAGRGAAEQVAEWYVAAVRAYRARDYTKASWAFGVMSHYYADVTQPFHSKYAGGYKSYHRPYEVATSNITHSANAAPAYCTSTRAPAATDVRRMTVAAAAYSRHSSASWSPASRASSGDVADVTKKVRTARAPISGPSWRASPPRRRCRRSPG